MSRRSRRRASKRRRADGDRRQHPAASTHSDTPREQILHEEYGYVLADLKRIGVLATVMVALLVALSLLMR